jgi:hypothetical protein
MQIIKRRDVYMANPPMATPTERLLVVGRFWIAVPDGPEG